MKRGLWVTGLAVFVFVICFSLCGFSAGTNAPSQPKKDPGAMVMNACRACHDLNKVCNALGKKDKDAWTLTVNKMVKKGAALDKGSAAQVIEYLTGLKAGSQHICK